MQFKLRLIPAATAAFMLVACGGGSDAPSSPTPTPSSGVAVDGYIQFAQVVCDLNDNGIKEASETAVYTRIDGNFTFPNGCTHNMFVRGGRNIDITNADGSVTVGGPFVGVLRAPAGAKVVSPLTTLLSAGMTSAQVITALGLPADTDLLNDDPMINNPELLKKTVMMQNMMQKITEVFIKPSGTSGSVATSAVYTEVAAAFAEILKTGVSPISNDGTSDEAVINTLIKAAADKVLASATVAAVAPAVITGMNKVGSINLAGALDKALKADADKILVETDPVKIASTTLIIQANEEAAALIASKINAGTLTTTSSAAQVDAVAEEVKMAVESGSTTPPTGESLSFSSGYTDPVEKGEPGGLYYEGTTAEGGDWGYYSDGFPTAGNAFTGGTADYRYIGTASTAAPLTQGPNGTYLGIYNKFKAGGLTLSGQTFVTIELAADADYIASGKNTLTVEVDGAQLFNNGAASDCRLRVSGTVKPTSIELTSYQVPLTEVKQSCNQSSITSVADVLARPIGAVNITAGFPNINNTNANADGKYVTAFTLGKISFTKGGSGATPATDYLYLTDNAITLFNGASDDSYSMTQFQSVNGINVKWPMAENAALKLNLAEKGIFLLADNQTLSAAMQITETRVGGLGEIKGYINDVKVTKSGSSVTVTVPNVADALLYGVSGDGKMKAVIDFAGAVRGVTNTLFATGAVNSIILGEVVNYAINGVSNDFTGMNALRGKYKVKIVVSELPLRKTDGSKFDVMTIEVPTTMTNGVPGTIVPVNGYGIEGYINLTD